MGVKKTKINANEKPISLEQGKFAKLLSNSMSSEDIPLEFKIIINYDHKLAVP